MAACVWKTWCSTLKSVKLCTRNISFSARRYLLSEAYSCQDTWTKRLESKSLQQISLNEFAIQLRDKFEKEKKASVVDVDILANKLHEMDATDSEYMEDILHRFRHSPDAVPLNDSIVYAVVRAYIDLNLTDKLISMIKDKWNYGIFPNTHATNLLMDHFIKQENYEDAAQIAYEMMLQEDFSHPLVYLLSLYSCIKHYPTVSLAPPEEIAENPDEEEEWVAVGIIRYPVYDDHFDIKDERFLMGKTLYMLGKTTLDNEVLSRTLQFMGLGMYQKFEKALKLLEGWEKDVNGTLVYTEALSKFEESLSAAEIRPDEEPEKELGLRRIEDEIRLLRITADEKEKLTERFNEVKARISDKVQEENLQSLVEELVKSQTSQYEQSDIKTQTELIAKWSEDRENLIKKQIWEYKRQQKEEELKKKLKELQEKEETLKFFELRDEIIMASKKAPKDKPPVVEEDEDTIIEKRKKRRKYRTAV